MFPLSMDERIIYCDQNADLAEFISALKSTKADTVIFVLPRKSLFFESIVNLQILRSEAEGLGKSIVVISILAKGRKMCEIAGIESHPTLEHWEKKIPGVTIAAKKNKEEDFSRASTIRRVPIIVKADGDESPEETPPHPRHWRDLLTKPSWEALLGLLIFSAGLFFFLSFLAFPGATIEIKPEKKAVETIMNITLYNAEKTENETSVHRRDGISGYPIESVFEKEIEFSTISKEFRGNNASGEIVIFNQFLEERRLRPTTRFQTADGIIYRIADWVVVPPATTDESGNVVPGKRAATVTADEQDVFGRFVGEMGNITPTTFFLPGLPESARSEIWAESEKPFTGGYTDWTPKVLDADIEASKNRITTELYESAQEDLDKFITEKNVREKTDLRLLTGDQFMEQEVLDIVVEENIVNTEKESFHVSAKLKVRTWAYSGEEMNTLLWEELAAKADPKMRLVAIDYENMHTQLLERNEASGYLKLSVSIRGAEEYIIDPRNETGILFVNEIKTAVLGMNKDEAEAYLANRGEISEVHISLWPFWSRKVPKLSENISVKLVQDFEAEAQ